MPRSRVHTTAIDGEPALVIPMPWPYIPFRWLLLLDQPDVGLGMLLTPVVVPVVALLEGIVRICGVIPAPPRAEFTLRGDEFAMELVSRYTGRKTSLKADRRAILALRKNQYERGLFVHIDGVSQATYLHDLDDATLTDLIEKLGVLVGTPAA